MNHHYGSDPSRRRDHVATTENIRLRVLRAVADRRRLKQDYTLEDIAIEVHRSKATVCLALKALEADGLLSEQPCTVIKNDLAPSKRGLELLQKAG